MSAKPPLLDASPTGRSSARHYAWGNACDGWVLHLSESLSIIEERMPSGTSEVRHRHERSRQFFYVLSGTLIIEIGGEEHALTARKGAEIHPAIPHCVFNRSAADAEFLVISSPPSHGDRMDEG